MKLWGHLYLPVSSSNVFIRKVMAPALYYVCSPLIALLAVFFVCALVVYCVVPCGRAAGLHFNNVSKEKNKKEKAMAKIQKVLIFHLAKHGLTWQDIEDSKKEGVGSVLWRSIM